MKVLPQGVGSLGERSDDGTLGLETEKLSEMGDRLPGEWVADPKGEGDRPWLMGLPSVDNIFLREWLMGTPLRWERETL